MTLKVYFDLMSQPCRAMILILKLNKIPYEPKVIALRKGEHFSPEFTQLNPMQKVPVINHDGFVLTESIAQIRYLCREFKVADHWYPKDSKQQAKVDEYLEWQHLNIRLFGSMVFRTRILTPKIENAPVDEAKLEYYKKNFEKTLENLETGFLKNGPYLCGSQISVADIFGACEVEQPLLGGYDPVSSRPIVKAWMERVKDDLEPQYTEVHKAFELLRNAVRSGKL